MSFIKSNINIDELIDFIREHQGISEKQIIEETTQLENGLGITGDDGCELLEAIEKKFGISFVGSDGTLREAFNLKDDEYLFHSENFHFYNFFNFNRDTEKVNLITVRQLYEAIVAQSVEKL